MRDSSEVGAFRDRTLTHTAYPYVYLDATYCKTQVNHRGVSQAVVIATGVTADDAVKCWASTSATPRTARSGPRSCVR